MYVYVCICVYNQRVCVPCLHHILWITLDPAASSAFPVLASPSSIRLPSPVLNTVWLAENWMGAETNHWSLSTLSYWVRVGSGTETNDNHKQCGMAAYIHICKYSYIHIIYICVYICIYVYMHMCVYIYIYIYIHIYIHTHIHI